MQNVRQLVAGSYAMAFSLADTAADAVAGTGSFAGGKQPVQALARIHTNYTQVVVRRDAGITDVAACAASGSPRVPPNPAPRSSPNGC